MTERLNLVRRFPMGTFDTMDPREQGEYVGRAVAEVVSALVEKGAYLSGMEVHLYESARPDDSSDLSIRVTAETGWRHDVRIKMYALFTEQMGSTSDGDQRQRRIAMCSMILGRHVDTTKGLSTNDVSAIVRALESGQ